MMTKLDAVNRMLDSIGEEPVSSLTSGLPDAEKAERILDVMTREILSLGWHCNTVDDIQMPRDVNDEIALGDDILQIDTTGQDAAYDVTVRRKPGGGRYLFDRKDNSFTLDRDPHCEIIYLFDFEDVTPALQNYIYKCAAEAFQESEMGSVRLDQFIERAKLNAVTALQDAEGQDDDYNVLIDSPHCRAMTQRNSPFFGR